MRAMGYTPKHAKPASVKDAALSQRLTAINTPSIGRHAITASSGTGTASTVAGATAAKAAA
jgi:hypothetical protein